jgi:putative (di)nucleoside polyphosphate hydrolase
MTSTFRAGVGAVIINKVGLIFSCERINQRGAWQMPQGGLENLEEPLDGVYREVEEETGIAREKLDLLAEHPEWLVYEFDEYTPYREKYRGQAQKWFLFRYNGDGSEIQFDLNHEVEFCSWKWMAAKELMENIVEFKQETYAKIFEQFSDYLK